MIAIKITHLPKSNLLPVFKSRLKLGMNVAESSIIELPDFKRRTAGGHKFRISHFNPSTAMLHGHVIHPDGSVVHGVIWGLDGIRPEYIISDLNLIPKNPPIPMCDLEPMQCGIIVPTGSHCYGNRIVMRTASTSQNEVVDLSIIGQNQCWTWRPENQYPPKLPVQPISLKKAVKILKRSLAKP